MDWQRSCAATIHPAIAVSWPSVDDIDRTAKILIDLGLAFDPEGARDYLNRLVLQVAVGPELDADPAIQAALMTVVNVGRRAFKGGIDVHPSHDPVQVVGWGAGSHVSEVVTRFGGKVVAGLRHDRPTLVLGSPTQAAGDPVLYMTWAGWSAGVVQHSGVRQNADGTVLAAILASGLGISEMFQRSLGNVMAGRRDVGLSLWRPDLDWRLPDAIGPKLTCLPSELWLLGLGHLGQAYAWILGMLPYANTSDCSIGLLDFDVVVPGNTATQLLTGPADVGNKKARVVAAALEELGMRTRISERAFDEHFRTASHADQRRQEPLVALTGFDDVVPRRHLESANFKRTVDGGLGAGPVEYLDMLVHTFPSAISPAEAFREVAPRTPGLRQAYQNEIDRRVSGGIDRSVAQCGLLDIAGTTVGAAFVGTVTGTFVVADILRVLHGGQNYSIVALDLREPGGIRAVANLVRDPYLPKATRTRESRAQSPGP